MDITYEGTDIIVCVYIYFNMYVLLYHYMVAPMLATYYMSQWESPWHNQSCLIMRNAHLFAK